MRIKTLPFRAIVVAVVLAPLLAVMAPAPEAGAQDNGRMYFEETGFWIDPPFAEFWRDRGGLQTFGYPISRVFYQDGLHRQYFERAVFEHHEDEDPPYNVLLMRLGAKETVERRRAGEEPFLSREPGSPPSPDAAYFPETGHYLDGNFKEYWESNGGLQAFGFPLSEPFTEPGLYDGIPRRVQYFERARMEYHEEHAGTQYEILLGHLGVEELRTRVVPEEATTPQSATLAAGTNTPIGPQPLYPDRNVNCGFNLAFWGDAAHDQENQDYMDLLKASGCEWVRVQFTWAGIEPDPDVPLEERIWAYDRIVNLARERDLKVLVNVNHPPDWALSPNPEIPADPDEFASFLSRLVDHFAGRVQAWQIWNEPNDIRESNGVVDPAGLLALAEVAYPAVKEADPDALVVSPGLTPTSLMYEDWALDDTWYLEQLFGLSDGQVADYFDVFAVHAYGAGNSPDHYWPSNPAENPGWTDAPEFYFRHVEAIHRLLVMYGAEDKPVWITEMGWTTSGKSGVHGYGEWITEELQAQYLRRAFEIIRTEWDWVENFFVWHLNAAPYAQDDSSFAGFSVTDIEGQPRPAYKSIQDVTLQWCQDLPRSCPTDPQ